MGNSLVLFCPRCGREGQMNVVQTELLAATMSLEGGERIVRSRTRLRYCSRCSSTAQTTEMLRQDAQYLHGRARLADILIARRARADAAVAAEHPARLEAMKCLEIIAAVFAGKVTEQFRDGYPLSQDDCLSISDCTLAALGTLNEECARAIRLQFGVFLRGEEHEEAAPKEVLQRAIRMLKHPTRSRRLGRFADFVSA